MRRCKSQFGFSLTELLVVVAIVTVLGASLLPALARSRESARRASCANNMRQMAMAMKMFAAEHGGAYPPQGSFTGPFTNCADPSFPNWPISSGYAFVFDGFDLQEVYPRYLSQLDLLVCPSDPSVESFENPISGEIDSWYLCMAWCRGLRVMDQSYGYYGYVLDKLGPEFDVTPNAVSASFNGHSVYDRVYGDADGLGPGSGVFHFWNFLQYGDTSQYLDVLSDIPVSQGGIRLPLQMVLLHAQLDTVAMEVGSKGSTPGFDNGPPWDIDLDGDGYSNVLAEFLKNNIPLADPNIASGKVWALLAMNFNSLELGNDMLAFDGLDRIPNVGTGNSNTILRMRDGVTRFLITDINNSTRSGRYSESVAVLFDHSAIVGHGSNHLPIGSNVLYLDGHVAFEAYPGPDDHPVVSRAATAFRSVVNSEDRYGTQASQLPDCQ